MTNTNSNEKDIVGSITTLYILTPVLLVISMLFITVYILREIGVAVEYGFAVYALIIIPIATIFLPIGAILAGIIKGKQAENDDDRKSISKKKIYIVYFFTILYSIFSIAWVVVTAVIFSAILTRMFIVNIKDEHKDRGLKAFIIAHLLYIAFIGWMFILNVLIELIKV